MISDIYDTTAKAKQLYLDPLTKILLCLTISSIMLVSSNSETVKVMKIAFSIVPFIFLLILKKFKMAAYYFIMYSFSAVIPRLLIPYLPNVINVLFTGMIALFTQSHEDVGI